MPSPRKRRQKKALRKARLQAKSASAEPATVVVEEPKVEAPVIEETKTQVEEETPVVEQKPKRQRRKKKVEKPPVEETVTEEQEEITEE